MQRAREERETEIIVEITYELCAEETGGNEIERAKEGEGEEEGEGEATRLFPRDFLIIYRARVFLSPLSRENKTAMRFRELQRIGIVGITDVYGRGIRAGRAVQSSGRMSLSVWISLQ